MVWNVNVGKTNDNSINGLTFQTQNMKMQNVDTQEIRSLFLVDKLLYILFYFILYIDFHTVVFV